MKEKDIIDLQKKNGDKEFYLLKVGMFYHAYDCGAFALSRATRYKIKKKIRKNGDEVLVCGFPLSSIEKVKECVKDIGGAISSVNDNQDIYLIKDIDGSPDLSMVDVSSIKAKKEQNQISKYKEDIIHEILCFDINNSTPVSAWLFLMKIQEKIKNCVSLM